MEKKLKIADFAEAIGTTPKTVYKLEERQEIITVNERVNNRLIKLVVTSDEQIEEFRNIYRKDTDNYRNYEDILTSVESKDSDIKCYEPEKTSEDKLNPNEVIDRIITLNNEYNVRLNTVNEELLQYKSRIPLLEDKANREGYYLNEINKLEKSNTILHRIIYSLILFIILIVIFLTGYFTYQFAVNTEIDNKEENITPNIQTEKIEAVSPPVAPRKK